MPILKNLLRLVAQSSNPTGVAAGDTYFSTTTGTIWCYTGSAWVDTSLTTFPSCNVVATTGALSTATGTRYTGLTIDTNRTESGWSLNGANTAIVVPSGKAGYYAIFAWLIPATPTGGAGNTGLDCRLNTTGTTITGTRLGACFVERPNSNAYTYQVVIPPVSLAVGDTVDLELYATGTGVGLTSGNGSLWLQRMH